VKQFDLSFLQLRSAKMPYNVLLICAEMALLANPFSARTKFNKK